MGYLSQFDDLSALWTRYKYTYVADGRVVALDEHGITTSEGQSYGMLRAAWMDDRATFDKIWEWTKRNLQVRDDKLFAWKWQDRVVDFNTASDADVDVALALLLAHRRFGAAVYEDEARRIIRDIGRIDVVKIKDRYHLTAGNWAARDEYPKVHVAYHAPYAYAEFATVDNSIPWEELANGTYDLLRWIYADANVKLPPEFVFIDRVSGKWLWTHPRTKQTAAFGYDAVPLFWRLAIDKEWFGRRAADLRQRALAFFEDEWKSKGKIFDRYTLSGKPLTNNEGLPHYATVHTLAQVEGSAIAEEIERTKLRPLLDRALDGEELPYYLQNWLWFDRAASLRVVRDYDEFLGFLRPFDFEGFSRHFPWYGAGVAGVLFLLARFSRWLKVAFLLAAFYLALSYLTWRLVASLNFAESVGPFISIALWAAEAWGLATIALLWLQVGTKRNPRSSAPGRPDFCPSVDIMIPIYSESLEILEATLVGAVNISYPNKRVHVLDDSHRDDVRTLAEEFGAMYIKGPRKHAKAGNLNHALTLTSGELVVVFDTDHIPTSSFLAETVPPFDDERLGIVQTPHVFYNEDIFQRAFCHSAKVCNEQDMFNHGIQGGRDTWGGAFFVGSGAVFRRRAIEDVGGFNLMSITEDIHTSQLMQAKGWGSAFVDKNLAVGLSAENLASFVVQRRRWMLGCLQIFFRDNPLLKRGLPLRHRLGYFASLSYFFFPATRLLFWITPIYYLLFHWHPLLSEVSILLAYLVPFFFLKPMMTAALLPGWPRSFWGETYENVCSFTLFRAMFDLLLPKSLGFKVTPKGITSNRRRFDWSSSKATIIVTLVTIVAVAKGIWEFSYFGIEKEAYFFNIGWASYNLLFLFVALLLAWERPQKREHERVKLRRPIRIEGGDLALTLPSHDISVGGLSVESAEAYRLPEKLTVTIDGTEPIRLEARLVHQEKIGRRRLRIAFQFLHVDVQTRRRLIREIFTHPETWVNRHESRTKSSLVLAWFFAYGVVLSFLPAKERRRTFPREASWRVLRFVTSNGPSRVWQINRSSGGFAVTSWAKLADAKAPVLVLASPEERRWAQLAHTRRNWLGLWRCGFKYIDAPAVEAPSFAYIVA